MNLWIFLKVHITFTQESDTLIFLYQKFKKKSINDIPLTTPGNMDCTLIKQLDVPLSFFHHRPVLHQRNLRHHVNSRKLMWCYFDSYSIGDKNAVCQPLWANCCTVKSPVKKNIKLSRLITFHLINSLVIVKVFLVWNSQTHQSAKK